MKQSRLLGVSLCALLLTGCATSTSLKPGTPPPADAMTPCDALPTFNSSNSSNTADLIGYNISVMQAYGKCSLKLQSLQAWVKVNGNYSNS